MLRLKGDLAKELNTQGLAKEALFDPASEHNDAIDLDTDHSTILERRITDISKEVRSTDRGSKETTSHISGLTDTATVMYRLSKKQTSGFGGAMQDYSESDKVKEL